MFRGCFDPANELFTKLLYLTWQKNGHYKNIEQPGVSHGPYSSSWSSSDVAEQAPESRRTLRAIEEKLRSIPKDIAAVGLQKFFEKGAPTRRKPERPAESGLVIKTNNTIQPKAKEVLALPAPKRNTATSSIDKSATINNDDIAIAVDKSEAGANTPKTEIDLPSVSIAVTSTSDIKKASLESTFKDYCSSSIEGPCPTTSEKAAKP